MRRLTILSVMCLVLGLSFKSQAALETFDLSYAGENNSAIGTGTITVDTSLISTSGTTSLTGVEASPATPFVTAFSLTISNASSPAADGTFGISDFNSGPFGDIFITLSAPVDFSQNLVGQAGFEDFNFFPSLSGTGAPSGFVLKTIIDGNGDELLLTSFAPAVTPPSGGGGSSVPLPSGLPAGLLTLGTLAIAIRRRQPSIC
jgi:hypothetical protein